MSYGLSNIATFVKIVKLPPLLSVPVQFKKPTSTSPVVYSDLSDRRTLEWLAILLSPSVFNRRLITVLIPGDFPCVCVCVFVCVCVCVRPSSTVTQVFIIRSE